MQNVIHTQRALGHVLGGDTKNRRGTARRLYPVSRRFLLAICADRRISKLNHNSFVHRFSYSPAGTHINLIVYDNGGLYYKLKWFKIPKMRGISDWSMHVLPYCASITKFGREEGMFHLKERKKNKHAHFLALNIKTFHGKKTTTPT